MKKQLNKQAISFSLVLFLSWFSFASLVHIPGLVKMIAGEAHLSKDGVLGQMLALVPAAIMIAITVALNYILKPDLSRYFKTHITFGLVPILLCTLILASFIILVNLPGDRMPSDLLLLYINLYWIVPALSLLIEVIYYISQRVYKKPKELIVLLVSNANISLLITYYIELCLIMSSI